jgi:hypothetical protein
MRTVVILLLLNAIAFSFALIRDTFPETKAFTVKAGLQNMKATVMNGNAVCEVKFSTINCENRVKKEEPKKIDPKKRRDYSAIQKLKGSCFSKDIGFWNYQFCVGGKLEQKHGDESYILGRYQERNKDTQLYTNGTSCNINGKTIIRKTSVKFMCDNNIAIASLTEPETCSYSAIFTHPTLCEEGLPFERYIASPQNGANDNARLSPYDHFFLSLEQDSDEKYICSLSTTLRDLKPRSTTCFSKISLEIQKVDTDTLSEVVARHSNRRSLSQDEFEVDGLKVSSTQEFDGYLEYIKIRT